MTALGRVTPAKMAVPAEVAGRDPDPEERVDPGAGRSRAPSGMTTDGEGRSATGDPAGSPLPPSSRRAAPERGGSGTHEATGATAEPLAATGTSANAPALADDRAGLSTLHRDYLAARIKASVAAPGRIVVTLPSVFLEFRCEFP